MSAIQFTDLKNKIKPDSLRDSKLVIGGCLAILLFVAFVRWAGLPPARDLPLFIAGVLFLGAAIIGFSWLGWHLLSRALPANHRTPAIKMIRASQRQLLAVLIAFSGINMIVGAFWDEVWHRDYGVPFGQDLLWRPHLLIYSSFFLIAVIAVWAFYHLIYNGQGTLQQRFRADPVLGLLVLFSGFLVYAVVADPLWHLLYGEDITAWSLPHLVLMLSFTLVMLLSVITQLSTLAVQRWQSLFHAPLQSILIIFALAFVSLIGFQIMTTEWDAASVTIIYQRPAWLLPALIVAISAGIGTIANHSLRVYGAATAVGLLALLIRSSLLSIFNYDMMSADVWICALPPMIALDILYAYSVITRDQPPAWGTSALATTAGAALASFFLINQFFVFPTIRMSNLAPMLGWSLIAALIASWAGTTIGDYLSLHNKQLEEGYQVEWQLRFVPPVALVVLIGFIVFFITTATPPL